MKRKMVKRVFFRNSSGILWLTFALLMIFYCESGDIQNPRGNTFYCDQPLESQIREFPSKSRANKLRASLRYDGKPFWPLQWFLTEEKFSVNNVDFSPSMKIVEMHKEGYKGSNVGVVIIGNTPINCSHEEIRDRCQKTSSDSPNLLSLYPKKSFLAKVGLVLCLKKEKICPPEIVTMSSAVAGIIGMRDDGRNGGVGIAPKCTLGNVVIEPSSESGSPEYCAAKIVSNNADPPAEVFVHSWVHPSHDYKTKILHTWGNIEYLNFSDPKTPLKPHVMGSGDYGIFANSCQCNEYANADSMFVFGSVTYNGYLVAYSETCASLIGVTYSSSMFPFYYYNVITIHSSDINLMTCAPCSTSVSAAIGGGVIALIIDHFKTRFGRSPSVSDLTFLLAFSSNSEELKEKNTLWFSNGVGLMHSPQAGFGLPNMINVLSLLHTWTPMEFPTIYEVYSSDKNTLTYSSNLVCSFKIVNSQARYHIQLVSVELSAKLEKRGALSVYLISPAGTVSCILEGRPFDSSRDKYDRLLLRTNHFIGEQLEGTWSIRFYTYKDDSKFIFDEELSTPDRMEGEEDFPQVSKNLPIEGDDSNQTPGLTSSHLVPNPSSGASMTSSTDLQDELQVDDKSHGEKKVSFSPSVVFKDESNPQFPQSFDIQGRNEQTVLHQSPTLPIAEAISDRNAKSASKPHPQSNHVNSQNDAVPVKIKTKKQKPTIVYSKKIKFRFVLCESLPLGINVETKTKNQKQIEKNFELLKAWVDFRHYLIGIRKSDPSPIDVQRVNVFHTTNRFVKKLRALQKNQRIESLLNIPPSRLDSLTGIENFLGDEESTTSSDRVNVEAVSASGANRMGTVPQDSSLEEQTGFHHAHTLQRTNNILNQAE